MDARRTGDVFLLMLRGVSMSGDAMLEGGIVAVRRTRQPNHGDAERLEIVGVVVELVRLYRGARLCPSPTMPYASNARPATSG